MDIEELFAMVFTIGMFSGVIVIYMAMRQRALQMEMLHRERMAMIEKGQVPLELPPHRMPGVVSGTPEAGMRSISLGIVVIAIGLGLMSIVAIASEAVSVGVGIGGAIMIVGAAFVVIGVLRRGQGGMSSSSPSSTFDRREP
jgi:hypothetical protein